MGIKDKIISGKKLPYEYNICLYVLEELWDKVPVILNQKETAKDEFRKLIPSIVQEEDLSNLLKQEK